MLFDGDGFILQMQRLHSHSLGGCSGSKQRRREWISGLGRGGSVLGRLSLG
jgi:hypothetical protein